MNYTKGRWRIVAGNIEATGGYGQVLHTIANVFTPDKFSDEQLAKAKGGHIKMVTNSNSQKLSANEGQTGCEACIKKDEIISEMYEALKAMNNGSFLDPDNPDRVWERACPSNEAVLKAFRALAKAEGK